MRILLSGGWGYGNLGDDAILIATLKNIYSIQSTAEVCILSANPHETYYNIKHLFPDAKIRHSFHPILFGNVHRVIFQQFLYNYTYIDKIIKHLNRKLLKRQEKRLSKNIFKNTERILAYIDKLNNFEYKNLFQNSDFYIMSGGGYLNDWMQMGVSKYIEVMYAHKYKVPVSLIGQTIGPFDTSFQKEIVRKILNLSSHVYFRDKGSYSDFASEFDDFRSAKAMPDIALSDEYHFSKKRMLTFIPFLNDIKENIDIISQNIIEISLKYNLQVNLTISQLWVGPMQLVQELFEKTKSSNIDVQIIIPENENCLQTILGKSELVISQNLHGLIMAYRAGTPIICLNSRRKFLTFMEQINSLDCLISPENIKSKDCLANLYEIARIKERTVNDFKREIHDIFEWVLK
ncbi:MAG: polysaccharide pyruvyl transferase family protein [Prevotella sp.]|nr:polysaccharide pyruvyl transferase family protein [Prevotella sp.]